MHTIKIVGAHIVNEGQVKKQDILVNGPYIEKIDSDLGNIHANETINAEGLHLFPGIIDDQVHFREPGLTHKGTIKTESKAAVAGGITSFMEMPNTKPPALTLPLLEDKYNIAHATSAANYSFFMGASNSNYEEVKAADPTKICGIKVFMGSSTGNMLVDNEKALEQIFSESPMLVATHCEDEATIQANLASMKEKYGDNIPFECHPLIRSHEACYKSSSKAVKLAETHGTRLHILHISTAREVALFKNDIPLTEKKITAEACIHHLWFSEADYEDKGSHIKWNPAVKTQEDREAIWKGVMNGHIDVIATDHAPHTREEKDNPYTQAPSGGPLIQHSLPAMLEKYHEGLIDLPFITQKMSHNPAEMFQIDRRGFIREGYFADLCLVNLNKPWKVAPSNILYHCGWSPFEGYTFTSQVQHTLVSGNWAYRDGQVIDSCRGMRLAFNRN